MNREFSSSAAVCALLALSAALPAQEIQSGPAAGMKLTKVGVYAATGPYKGKEFDASTELGKGPGALLFVKDLTRETAPIIRSLDQQAAEFGLLGFRAFTVLLNPDRTAGEKRIQTVSGAIRMRNPMVLSLDGAEGPGNYGLNRSATMTLVLVKDGAVTKSIPFTETGAKDIPMLTEAIESVAGKLPASLEERAKLLPDDSAALKRTVVAQWQEIAQLRRQIQNLQNRRRGGRNMQRERPARPRGQGGQEGRGEKKKAEGAGETEEKKKTEGKGR